MLKRFEIVDNVNAIKNHLQLGKSVFQLQDMKTTNHLMLCPLLKVIPLIQYCEY